jgi:hypothetical protein
MSDRTQKDCAIGNRHVSPVNTTFPPPHPRPPRTEAHRKEDRGAIVPKTAAHMRRRFGIFGDDDGVAPKDNGGSSVDSYGNAARVTSQ